MKARIIKTSDTYEVNAYNRTFKTLKELVDFIESDGDKEGGVVIFKREGTWVVEIYDGYRE